VNKPLRILAVVNTPWDPRLGAARVWIELAEEWRTSGHVVENYCLTDAFPVPTSSPRISALRLTWFPFCAAKFIRRNAHRFDVIDALAGTLTCSKKSLRFRGLLVARSVGLYDLYEKFERDAARRWPSPRNGKILGRIFYGLFFKGVRAATHASIRHSDLLNLPNSDERRYLRDEAGFTRPAMVQPYGLAREHQESLSQAAASSESRWRNKTVCFIGMWTPRKGAKDWGRIIRHIRARVPEARFLFLGTMAPDERVLNDLGPGVGDFVELVERFQPDELPKLLSDCAVAGFPSYVEGFGLAVVEQLAAGIPVVAYNVTGPRDILHDSLPELLVASGDVVGFSETIVEILTNDFSRYEQLRHRCARAAEKFSWSPIARDTIEEYRRRLALLRQANET
jgi:glycosyltransferase involved in cell wall biosynthesis